MPSWSEIHQKYTEMMKANKPGWLDGELFSHLEEISKLRKGNTVIFYASGFLQKSDLGGVMGINREDMNGFMNAIHGTAGKRLTLILHTPGGDPSAVESIVEYLHGKFDYMEVVVPYLAMSGGAMITLAGDSIIIGKAGQIGPIDAQFVLNNSVHSARAIQEIFSKAEKDIKEDIRLAHLWAPVLQKMGPSLILEAEKNLSYSGGLIKKWLGKKMLKDNTDIVDEVVKYFNAERTVGGQQIHVHGQRIGGEKLREIGLAVEWLEENQELQEAVLTVYHIMTIIFEQGGAVKFIANHQRKMWVKEQGIPVPPVAIRG